MDSGDDSLSGLSTKQNASVTILPCPKRLWIDFEEAFVQHFLVWLEATDFSTWLRESESIWAFPTILTVHTVSMGFLAGVSAAIDLRMLGFAPRTPLLEMKKFLPVLWISFWVSVVTGINLLIAYPTKAITNPIFYVKLTLIALSLFVVRLITKRVLTDPDLDLGPAPRNVKALALISLVCWLLLIWAGRALPYTYGRLFAIEGRP